MTAMNFMRPPATRKLSGDRGAMMRDHDVAGKTGERPATVSLAALIGPVSR